MVGREEQEQREHGKRHHIALFPCPFHWHINSMLQLANILHSRGFSITIIHHHLYSPNRQTHPNFRFEPISDGLSDQQSCELNVLQLLWAINLNYERPLRECLVHLQRENPVSCLITDALLYITQSVADELGISRIVLHTNNPLSFLVLAKHPLLWLRGYFPIRDRRSQEPVAELPPLRVKDLPDLPNVDPAGHSQLVDQIIEKTKAASALIINSFDYLEQAVLPEIKREFPLPTFMVGPLYKSCSAFPNGLLDHDRSCIDWLDKQLPGSVLYISFGTVVEIEERELVEMAWGLANSEHPFLWAVRHGSVIGAEEVPVRLLPGFVEKTRERGRVIAWAPQQQVLAHPAVGGFWTHCGWNSTIESICEGVPMLCSPRIGDQSLNARLVSYVWKVGLEVEGDVLRREEIERAVRRLMAEREGDEVRVRSRALKEDAVTCVGKGGSSYESINKLVSRIMYLSVK